MNLKSILYVEDDADIRLVVSLFLKQKGMEVVEFASGTEAVTEAANVDTIPDIILLDLMMRDLDGFATLERLRCIEAYQNVPCVFLTARADASTAERLAQLPLTGVIYKPFKLDELIGALENVMFAIRDEAIENPR